MSLKNINEAFERHFNEISDSINEEASVLESLRNILRNLKEAPMSDEDRRESDLIRSAYAKIQKRSNARLTPEEQAVLDKYGIVRDYDKQLHYKSDNPRNRDNTLIVNNPEDSLSHGEEVGRYHYPKKPDGSRDYDKNSYKLNTKNQDKINYADRARKRPERAKNRSYDYTYTYDDYTGFDHSIDDTGIIDYNNRDDKELPWYARHSSRGVSQNTAINRMAQSKMNKMKGAIGDRKSAQQDLDNAQAEFDRRKADADIRYMKAMQSAEKDYDSSMDYYRREKERKSDPSRRNRAQDKIDALLGKKKTEAVDLSDKEGSITKVLSDNDSWKKESTVQGIYKKVKDALEKNNISTPASKRLLANIMKQKSFDKALETVYNSILAGSNLAMGRGTSKNKKNESLDNEDVSRFDDEMVSLLWKLKEKYNSASIDDFEDAFEYFLATIDWTEGDF